MHGLPLFDEDVSPNRQHVTGDRIRAGHFGGLAGLILDGDAGTIGGARMVNDALARQAGPLTDLFFHRDAFHDVAERSPPADFGEDGQRVRAPLDEPLTYADLAPVLDLDLGPVHYRILLALPPRLVMHGDLGVPAHDDPVPILAPDRDRRRSEERRVGKECRSRWSPYH